VRRGSWAKHGDGGRDQHDGRPSQFTVRRVGKQAHLAVTAVDYETADLPVG
jgi:hypothetical protein